MSTYIFILGKHPELSIAELESRYPKHKILAKGGDFVVMDLSEVIDQKEFDQLGGCIKAAKLAKEVDKEELVSGISDVLFDHYHDVKLDYGLSLYGTSESQLRTFLMKLKKRLRTDGVKSRFINNDFKNISAAQYKSIKKKGIELVILKNGNQFMIAEVVGVQDIDSYSKRDFDKPFRSMQMGMMPPKLAQILINLTGVKGGVWDPFCGSGTLVMEGLLMGRDMIGSDINPKHIEGAKQNIDWTIEKFEIRNPPAGRAGPKSEILVHDATEDFSGKFDAIAFEGDLGIPHNQLIHPDKLEKIVDDLDQLYIRFFENLKAMQCAVPIVAALPFFKLRDGDEIYLKKTLLAAEKLGFKRDLDLKYFREDQAVGRDIYRFELKLANE